MKRVALMFLAAVLVATPVALAQTVAPQGRQLKVSPPKGARYTTFRVTFNELRSGTGGGAQINAFLEPSKKHVRQVARCIRSFHASTLPGLGGPTTVKLTPGAYSNGWCIGTFSGTVFETVTPRCGPIVAAREAHQGACPQYIADADLGSFHFTVR